MSKERKLTAEERERVERVISHLVMDHFDPEDRSPEEVIRSTYRGNRDAYLRAMARSHGVSFSDPKPPQCPKCSKPIGKTGQLARA